MQPQKPQAPEVCAAMVRPLLAVRRVVVVVVSMPLL